jgi:hypothetical protein
MFKNFYCFERGTQFVYDRHSTVLNVKPGSKVLRKDVTFTIFYGFVIKVSPETSTVELTLEHVNNSSLTTISYNIRDIGDINLSFTGQSIFGIEPCHVIIIDHDLFDLNLDFIPSPVLVLNVL